MLYISLKSTTILVRVSICSFNRLLLVGITDLIGSCMYVYIYVCERQGEGWRENVYKVSINTQVDKIADVTSMN